MKTLFRQPHASRSGYAALAIFLIVYCLAMTLAIAPGKVMSVIDAAGQGH